MYKFFSVPIVDSPPKHRKKTGEDVLRFIIEYLQNNKHEYQFSINKISWDYSECQSSTRDIWLLIDEMDDDIVIHEYKHNIILCYHNTSCIVEAASEICSLEDIWSEEYITDNYPPCNDFF